MTPVETITAAQRSLSEAMIALTAQVRDDFPETWVREQLESLLCEAKDYLAVEPNPDLKLDRLLDLFFKQWGFASISGVYRLSEALWLDNVLKCRKGSAVSLGAILLYLSEQLEIPLFPVIFPTQLILRADWVDGEMWLINPFNGDTLDEHTLDVWVKGTIGPTSGIDDIDLEPATSEEVIRKLLETLKVSLMEENQMELALQISKVLVALDPDDPYEIRDRGLIYAQLECEHIALTDLAYFVEQCPEDPVSEMIKVQMHTIEYKSVTLH